MLAASDMAAADLGSELFQHLFHFCFDYPFHLRYAQKTGPFVPIQDEEPIFRGTTVIRPERAALLAVTGLPAGDWPELRANQAPNVRGGYSRRPLLSAAPFRVIFPFTAIKYLQLEYIYSTTKPEVK